MWDEQPEWLVGQDNGWCIPPPGKMSQWGAEKLNDCGDGSKRINIENIYGEYYHLRNGQNSFSTPQSHKDYCHDESLGPDNGYWSTSEQQMTPSQRTALNPFYQGIQIETNHINTLCDMDYSNSRNICIPKDNPPRDPLVEYSSTIQRCKNNQIDMDFFPSINDYDPTNKFSPIKMDTLPIIRQEQDATSYRSIIDVIKGGTGTGTGTTNNQYNLFPFINRIYGSNMNLSVETFDKWYLEYLYVNTSSNQIKKEIAMINNPIVFEANDGEIERLQLNDDKKKVYIVNLQIKNSI